MSEEKISAAKIRRSATVRRLRYLTVVTAAAGSALFCTGVLFAAFWKSGWGIAFAAAAFFLSAAFLFWVAIFVTELVKTLKGAGRYAFAVTNSASFECFGPFLAMNVTFFDETGKLREGRSRFLFGARDVEAWQNVPLEIAYLRPTGDPKKKTSAGKNKKPDLQPDAKVSVIGSAPFSEISRP